MYLIIKMKKHLFTVFQQVNALSITLNFSNVLFLEMKNMKIRTDQHKFAAKNNNPFYSFIFICMPNVNLKQSDLGYKK